MKSTKILLTLITAGALAAGCQKKFNDYEANPNRPLTVPPNLLLTGVLSDMNGDKPWSNVSRWNQFDNCNYNYYGDQRYDWTGASLNYLTLKNVVKMEEEAQKIGEEEKKAYLAIGKFIRAWYFYRMTNLVGDLPMTEALKGMDNTRPKYDSQKEIFVQILKWLDEANNELAALTAGFNGNAKIDGDIYFNDKTSWRRAINTFRLRVLILLSNKTADADLKVKQDFAAVMADAVKYPLMRSNAENLQYIYNNFNKYPSNPDNLGNDATRYNMSSSYLNTLVDLKDARAFVTAEPATQQLNEFHKTPADITAYVGAESGEELAVMSSKMSNVDTAAYSVRSRSRYYSSYTAEPGTLIGYAELCFNIAEAINRGWITGNAETWYKNGIKASMTLYGIPVDAAGNISKIYPYGSPKAVTYTIPFDFEAVYYVQGKVKYAGDNADGLKQILTQKYLAFFQNSGWEAYFNWRRTGVPTFSTGVGTGNSGRIPKRFRYPNSESTTNTDNLKEALKNQFSGADDINADMWLLK
ncbi:SusD/RagB family nutrient-binding outer membrane lipoprotein [Pseudoflavitalea sp. G-6-1-2]|uniref:SusD/RagB family nutrient-binding outer membrane lipoprotein n=1 Tax=Pseudoflavitalea sp. G-6-1-2 TaxID=2728841 RepID=UPI00146CCBAC|nr:SusD/RagB family nutrient-binding outer membrane lipoprotein [Pseudoflavitalea sp. G-6-1-2]NML23550.1 SusD/RagB family nutrient-binding outer membrane lipoprotein [Pseudoflavitalea sp. G-6-1-2]